MPNGRQASRHLCQPARAAQPQRAPWPSWWAGFRSRRSFRWSWPPRWKGVGVVCASPGDCGAGGYYTDSSGRMQALVDSQTW